MKHFFNFFLFILILFFNSSCDFFDTPCGDVEIISTYTTNSGEYHYLTVTLKISNIGNKDIYNSTISLKAESSIRTYYKTQTCNTVIKPNNSIYYPIEFQFEDEKTDESKTKTEDSNERMQNDSSSIREEKWIEDSVEIMEEFWN